MGPDVRCGGAGRFERLHWETVMVRLLAKRRAYRRRAGLEAVEYAILLGLIVSVAITTLAVLGNWVAGTFNLLISLAAG